MVVSGAAPRLAQAAKEGDQRVGAVRHSEEEWRKLLTPEQYAVLRQAATERPFSSPLNSVKATGTFICAACASPLFSSDAKYDSGTGWPSFFQPLEGERSSAPPCMMCAAEAYNSCAQPLDLLSLMPLLLVLLQAPWTRRPTTPFSSCPGPRSAAKPARAT